jgi:hypothetical protein
LEVENAADYAGGFTDGSGRKLEFAAEGKQVFLMSEGKRVPLQYTSSNNFVSTVEGVWADHTFMFGRAQPESGNAEVGSAPVVEISYGSDWYVNDKYSGPRSFLAPKEYAAFAGTYRSDSAWGGDAVAYVLKGRLMLNGGALTAIGAALFRIGDEEWMPDTAEFLCMFEGKARMVRIAGMDFWRVEID